MLREDYEKLPRYLPTIAREVDMRGVHSYREYECRLVQALKAYPGETLFLHMWGCWKLIRGTTGEDFVWIDLFSMDFYREDLTEDEMTAWCMSLLEVYDAEKSWDEMWAKQRQEVEHGTHAVSEGSKLYNGVDNFCLVFDPCCRNFYKKEDIFPLGTISFECYDFPAPANYEVILESHYTKKWRQLPPVLQMGHTPIATH